jgi:hypothetical protein
MTGASWIALAGLAFTVAASICAGAFQLGQHAQRLAALEERTKDVGTLAVLTAALAEVREQLAEIRQDLRDLLTGRLRPP